ncbi:MAG: LPS export ABC transporter permease LptG [Pseudomonadales bacterium]|jgi:lipopolysaccharide export system permease protein|nr:LPS export ABC transporter permease LptG [Pseudomonadales bacterium]MDP7360616.1 LPS export ABC transporter permease LptG [Pseudomonadales bacterium]HJN51161.1 LPS export ABC transporter permease LptG [Pseudomonadales bacterium]|tara:strand:- start:1076 stop:2149 length:1074 start_codon:yes stop_codon:yes gene_type:complete
MKRLDNYLGMTVTTMMVLTILGLLGIVTLFALMEELERIEDGYPFAEAVRYVAYTTPRRFYELIPYASMIGALLGLGTLANNSELIVMRASGVSITRISWSAIRPALLLVLVGLAMGEYVVPITERIGQHDREMALSDRLLPESGYWYREGDTYMHFSEAQQEGVLIGVTHYIFDEQKHLIRTLFAARAVFHDVSDKEKYWLLEDIIATDLSGDGADIESFASLQWNTDVDPDLLRSEILIGPNKLAISELKAKVDYMNKQGLNTERYQLAFWQKTLQPLATIGLVFIAISFVFGPLRQVSMGLRIVAGLIIGFAFKIIQDILTPASMVFGFAPMLATLIPIVLCFLFAAYLMKRTA